MTHTSIQLGLAQQINIPNHYSISYTLFNYATEEIIILTKNCKVTVDVYKLSPI